MLVSQIVAGGVGLNIQAASVVVICEPQLKPTTEWQAHAFAQNIRRGHYEIATDGPAQRRLLEAFDELVLAI